MNPLLWTTLRRVSLTWKYSDDEPRDDHGRWTDGGGGDTSLPNEGGGHVWNQPVGADGRPIPIAVTSVEQAIPLVLAGKVVELPDVKSAATLLDDMASFAQAAKAEGKTAPNFDLCGVSVHGTNLFCGQSLRDASHPNGWPRIDMPQLGGVPRPGTPADKLPRTPWNPNEVDGGAQFVSHLQSLGIKVTDGEEDPANLKASQDELNGPKVAAMMQGKIDPRNPLFISRDNYIVDGHHRWAALVGQEAESGKLGGLKVHVHRIDAPISEVLHLANDWSKQFGIEQADAQGGHKGAKGCGCKPVVVDLRDAEAGPNWLSQPPKDAGGKIIPPADRDKAVKYSDDQPRDDHGRWTSGDNPGGSQADTSGDTGRLSVSAIATRHTEFAQRFGQATATEADHLAADWYTMRPSSHLDQFLQGTLPDGPEKTAWSAIQQDTQSRLKTDVPGDVVDLYRGIPGQAAADAIAAARASGATDVEIPIHDSQNHTHEAVCATGAHDLAAAYAASRWARHGGDVGQAHTGIVLHLRVPKADVVFSTSHSAFTNPYTSQWNEYVVRTGGSPVIRLPLKDVEVVGEGHKSSVARLAITLPVRLHPAEAVAHGGQKTAKYSDDEPRDSHGQWTDGGDSGGNAPSSDSHGGPSSLPVAEHEATTEVLARSGKDGNEHGAMIDQRTGQTSFITTGEPTAITLPNDGPTMDAANHLTFVHNHPSGMALSTDDLSVLASRPGITKMVAVDTQGGRYEAMKTDVTPKWQAVRNLGSEAAAGVREVLEPAVTTHTIDAMTASLLHTLATNQALANAGIFKFNYAPGRKMKTALNDFSNTYWKAVDEGTKAVRAGMGHKAADDESGVPTQIDDTLPNYGQTKARKYSDDQPRNDHGEWTDGGDSGGGAPAGQPDRLPVEQQQAVDAYTDGRYHEINQTLRAGGTLDGNNATLAAHIDAAIASATTPSDMTVYRGAGPHHFTDLKVGDSFTDPGFVSTSTRQSLADSFAQHAGGPGAGGKLFEIRVPKGAHMLDVGNVLPDMAYEEEFLLGRGHTFKVASISDEPKIANVKHVVLDMVK